MKHFFSRLRTRSLKMPGVASESRRSVLRGLLAASMGGLSLRAVGASPSGGLEQFYKFNIKPEVFLAEVFGPDVPIAQTMVVNGSIPSMIQPLPQRIRYWRADGRTAWIFDELGKEGYLPTTCGFVVRDDAIEQAKVLIYRESRGEQVGQPSFLQQLVGAKVVGDTLTASVDNISGATYSVKMMQRMARTALVLDQLAA
ncbi:MAG: FMN-binding protein [Panacagrimonas sp.]